MKVYVMTKAYPFKPEIFIGVKSNRKAAENELKLLFPALSYDTKNECYRADKITTLMLFIRECEI